MSPSFDRTLRKSKSAKLIEFSPSRNIETPFNIPAIKDSSHKAPQIILTPQSFQKVLKDFEKNIVQSSKNSVSQNPSFGTSGQFKQQSKNLKEKTESFGIINKDISKTILTQLNNKVKE